jgi:uncharacterized protein
VTFSEINVEPKLRLELDPRGVIVAVRAHAGARRNAIVGMRDGMLRVAVSEAPEKGKANKAIVEVLSKALGMPRSGIVIVSGASSPRKRFLLIGADAHALSALLQKVDNDR